MTERVIPLYSGQEHVDDWSAEHVFMLPRVIPLLFWCNRDIPVDILNTVAEFILRFKSSLSADHSALFAQAVRAQTHCRGVAFLLYGSFLRHILTTSVCLPSVDMLLVIGDTCPSLIKELDLSRIAEVLLPGFKNTNISISGSTTTLTNIITTTATATTTPNKTRGTRGVFAKVRIVRLYANESIADVCINRAALNLDCLLLHLNTGRLTAIDPVYVQDMFVHRCIYFVQPYTADDGLMVFVNYVNALLFMFHSSAHGVTFTFKCYPVLAAQTSVAFPARCVLPKLREAVGMLLLSPRRGKILPILLKSGWLTAVFKVLKPEGCTTNDICPQVDLETQLIPLVRNTCAFSPVTIRQMLMEVTPISLKKGKIHLIQLQRMHDVIGTTDIEKATVNSYVACGRLAEALQVVATNPNYKGDALTNIFNICVDFKRPLADTCLFARMALHVGESPPHIFADLAVYYCARRDLRRLRKFMLDIIDNILGYQYKQWVAFFCFCCSSVGWKAAGMNKKNRRKPPCETHAWCLWNHPLSRDICQEIALEWYMRMTRTNNNVFVPESFLYMLRTADQSIQRQMLFNGITDYTKFKKYRKHRPNDMPTGVTCCSPCANAACRGLVHRGAAEVTSFNHKRALARAALSVGDW